MEAFILLLMIMGVGMTIAAVKSSGPDSYAVWKAAAQRLGLQFEHTDMSGSPVISGARRGLSIRIDTYAKSGDNSRMYTRYRVSFKESLKLGLQLSRQGPLSTVAKKLGTQDILTGDPEFDEAVVVKGRDPEKIVGFLTPVRKRRVVRFLMLRPGTTIDDVKIESETRDVERSPDHIVQIVQKMTGLAECLTAEDSEANDYLVSMHPQESCEVDDHSLVLAETPEQDPILLEELLDVEEEGEVEYLDRDEDVAEETAPAEPASANELGISVSTLVEELFAQGQATSQAETVFEESFKGRSVELSGNLNNVRSFRFDLVYGDEPGTRAEFEVLKVSDGIASGRTVKAVVRFRAEDEEKLRALVDQRMTFRGVLVSCDAFMKTLFLTDGEVDA